MVTRGRQRIPHQPGIMLSVTSIDENAGLGSIVAGIIANGNPAPAFSIISDPDNKFDVSGSNLILDGALDYETDTSHNVTIRATNSAGSHDQVFIIQVNDVVETPTASLDIGFLAEPG